MTSQGWIILPTRDIRDNNKFHPVRYYVVTREEARILISHATATSSGRTTSPRQWKKLHISWLEPWSSQKQMPSRPSCRYT